MVEYIRLAEAPYITYREPMCGTCETELESDDGWLCPSCGTAWSPDAGDRSTGNLYEDWSGERISHDGIVDEYSSIEHGLYVKALRLYENSSEQFPWRPLKPVLRYTYKEDALEHGTGAQG